MAPTVTGLEAGTVIDSTNCHLIFNILIHNVLVVQLLAEDLGI